MILAETTNPGPAKSEHLGERPVVILGAGNLGRRVTQALRHAGITPLAFCDNNRQLWGGSVAELPVLSPADAAQRFPDALFLVAIWHPTLCEGLRHHIASLRALGCKHIDTFISVLRQFPKHMPPNLFWEDPQKLAAHREAAATARALLDEEGKAEFDRQWRFRLEGDPYCLAEPDPTPQYFPPQLVRLSGSECFVDCGAYDGDTLRVFLEHTGGSFARYIGLEPEPSIFARLKEAASRMNGHAERIAVYPYAVGAKRETLSFSAAGEGSSVSANGELIVESVALDELLAAERPTFIKMDIEGYELEALAGARHTIQRCRPKLAVCVYHRPDHLWCVPLAMHELLPNSRMTLRSHMQDGFDTVCYCLPE